MVSKKLSVWERVHLLLDGGRVEEFISVSGSSEKYQEWSRSSAATDGVVAGSGKIRGRNVMFFAQDASHMGGSMGTIHTSIIRRAVEESMMQRIPLIGLFDSAGARVQEGAKSMDAVGGLLRAMVEASGKIPQICGVMGTCVGGPSYSAIFGDFRVLVRETSHMFMWGPGVVKAETGKVVTADELGGADVHMTSSGQATLEAKDDGECILVIRQLLEYLPQNSREEPPKRRVSGHASKNRRSKILAKKGNGIDARTLAEAVFDKNSFLELQPKFARNVVIGLARLDGRTVGMVSTQPAYMKGFLDIDSSDKISGFVRVCDSFNIPIITFVDSSGFLPSVGEERNGVIRHGAKIVYAYSQATVPKITIITGEAHGAAYVALCSKEQGIDYVAAFPTADLNVLTAKAYVEIFRESKPESSAGGSMGDDRLARKYRNEGRPQVAVALGRVDEIIQPEDTRNCLERVLPRLIASSRKKKKIAHGNLPV